MPTYEYRCKECGQHLEVVQSFTDDALTTCNACGGPLRKVFGSIGITFKGSGFYKTDSRSGSSASSKPDGKSDKADAKTTGDKGESSTKASEPAGSGSKASESSGAAAAKTA